MPAKCLRIRATARCQRGSGSRSRASADDLQVAGHKRLKTLQHGDSKVGSHRVGLARHSRPRSFQCDDVVAGGSEGELIGRRQLRGSFGIRCHAPPMLSSSVAAAPALPQPHRQQRGQRHNHFSIAQTLPTRRAASRKVLPACSLTRCFDLVERGLCFLRAPELTARAQRGFQVLLRRQRDRRSSTAPCPGDSASAATRAICPRPAATGPATPGTRRA